jgi:hypothetical protein
MSDPREVQAESTEEVEDVQGNEQTTEQENPTPPEGGENGGNPAWQGILDKLDPLSQELIKPELEEWERQAQQRIEQSNSALKPWREVIDAGYTPDDVTFAISAVQQLNTPEGQLALFTNLRDFLTKEGRLPNEAEKQDIAEQTVEELSEDDPSKAKEDPRLSALEQRFRQLDEAEQQRQRDAALSQIKQEIESEFAQVQQAHPEFVQEDLDMIQSIAAGRNAQIAAAGKPGYFTVQQATDEFLAQRQRLLTTPRPGAGAPKLPPAGGAPVPTQDSRKASEIAAADFAKEAADWMLSQTD